MKLGTVIRHTLFVPVVLFIIFGGGSVEGVAASLNQLS